MIILVLISIPLLDASTWYSTLSVYDRGIIELSYYAENYPSLYPTKAL
jgi:hypothetical protein